VPSRRVPETNAKGLRTALTGIRMPGVVMTRGAAKSPRRRDLRLRSAIYYNSYEIENADEPDDVIAGCSERVH
jgi:hypothetical protein